MSKNNLTPSQAKAINYEGNNILVSAGAGSGKTSVLKERVIRKLKDNVRVDKLIILTFTNAAANEMKSRIIEAINKDPNLSYQLKYLENAVISTFDAFCLRIVREYYYLLNLPNNVNIGDSLLIKRLKNEVLENVLKKYYMLAKPRFVSLVKTLFQKGDALIYESVSSLAESLMKLPDYKEYIENYESRYFSEKTVDGFFEEYFEILNFEIKTVSEEFDNFFDRVKMNCDEKTLEYLNEFSRILHIMDDEKNFDILVRKLKNISYPRKPRIIDEEFDMLIKENINDFKKRVNSIISDIDSLKIDSKAKAIKAYFETKDRVLCLLEIAKDYINELEKAKKEQNLYSFDDIMKFAITLFEENVDIKNKFKEDINEIMIDEYQDTNDLQDYFISLISNNNLFMVGDIKQSIYGFRDANPKNFALKYKEYRNSDSGLAIDLRENFRSRKEVIDDINAIFSLIMDENLGGIDYKDGQSLIYGQKLFNLRQKNQSYDISDLIYDYEQIKEEDEDITKPIIEISLIAKDIREKIDKNYQIMDLEKKSFRNINYDDIAIIVDRKTDFQTYAKILCENNIPVNLVSDEPFKSSDEMLFLFQYLLLIETFINKDKLKTNFKKAFYSVSRSFVYQIPDQTIIDFLVNEEIIELEDLKKIEAYQELKQISIDIKKILPLVHQASNYEILLAIYKNLKLYSKIKLLAEPKKSQDKLDYFILKINDFTDFTFDDLILYLENIIENKEIDIEYEQKENTENTVTLLTMHKSKGLQFNVCYYPGINKQFNFVENKNHMVFDKLYGVILKSYNFGFYDTFLKKLSIHRSKTEYLSERIRLFYVALTRAKEKIVLINDIKDTSKSGAIINSNGYLTWSYRNRIQRFTDLLIKNEFINYIYSSKNELFYLPSQKYDFSANYKAKIKKIFFENDIFKLEKAGYSIKSYDIINDEQKSAIVFGKNIHHYLENVDFMGNNTSVSGVPDKIVASIDFLKSSFLFQKNTNLRIFKEFQFIDDSLNIGIIDLLIIRDDKVFILDYKLNDIDKPEYIEQLRGYKKYLMKHFDIPIEAYLYSLLKQELRFIEV